MAQEGQLGPGSCRAAVRCLKWDIERVPFDSPRLRELLSLGWEPFAATCDSDARDYVFLRRCVKSL